MKLMRIYVSGGITGVEDFKEKFAKAKEELEKQGYEVINPAIIELPKSCTWEDYMNICIPMLELADGIFMLNNWKKSSGACTEYGYAIGTDKIIMFEGCGIEIAN